MCEEVAFKVGLEYRECGRVLASFSLDDGMGRGTVKDDRRVRRAGGRSAGQTVWEKGRWWKALKVRRSILKQKKGVGSIKETAEQK